MNYFKIGDVFSLIGGGTPSTKKSDFWGSGTPWISSSDIDFEGNVSYSKFVTEKGILSSTTNPVPAGTVVVVTRVGLGKVCIIPVDMCFSQDMQALIPKKQELSISKEFLFYQIKYLMSREKYNGQGTTISGITKKHLADLVINLPSIDEQSRIVLRIEELFSELDNSVSTLQKTKKQLAVYRQASITSAYPVMTKENTKKLSEISEITGGITKGRDLKHAVTIYLPYLRVANVQNGFLDLAEIKEIKLKADEKEKYLLKKGDVLYTEGGDRDKLGRGTIWNEEIPNCVHQNHVFRARVDKSIAIPEYVAYWSMGSYARTYFFRKGKQTVNLASINKTVLSNLELPIPDLATQEKVLAEIESRLSVCNSIEQTVDTALQQAEAMRQSILKQAFEGRL